MDSAALVRALHRPRAHWRAGSLLSSSHCPPRSRNGLRETSASCATPCGRIRGRLCPETVDDRDPVQRQMESRRISATLRQRWSGRPPDECVFGASPVLRQALRDRPARRLGSLAATCATSSTPSQFNASRLVVQGPRLERRIGAHDLSETWFPL